MKRKILAMLLCVALTVALFGTLAVAAEENVTQPCTCGTETDTHAEGCPLYEAPKDETKDETKDVTPGEAAPQDVPAPVCNCGTETETHAETCPCYVAPAPVVPAPSAPVCNCESKDGTHAETCPCYVAPALTLFQKLMAAKTVEEFDAIASEAGAENLVLTCAEFDALEEHYYFLCNGVELDRSPVVYVVEDIPTSVNYTNVAPLPKI